MKDFLARNGAWITVLIIGLLIRLPFVPVDIGAVGDLNSFRSWGHSVYAQGLAEIYHQPDVNYPPLALAWFGAAAALAAHLPAAWSRGDSAFTAFIKFPTALADLGIGLVIMLAFRKHRALVLAAYVLNPAIWYVSAFWGQIDSVYALFLTACVFLLDRNRIGSSWLTFALAMTTKVMALAIAPTLVVGTWLKSGVHGLVRGLASALAVLILLGVPWLVKGDVAGVVRGSLAMQGSFSLATQESRLVMSGYNFWYLVRRGNVHAVPSVMHPRGLPLTYLDASFVVFALLQIAVIALLWRANSPPIVLAAAVSCLGFFLFVTGVHERYLFPTLGLVLMAAAVFPRLWWLYALLSATFCFNLITIVPFTPLLGTNLVAAEPLTTGVIVLKTMSLVAAALNVGALVWLLYELWRAPKRRTHVAVLR